MKSVDIIKNPLIMFLFGSSILLLVVSIIVGVSGFAETTGRVILNINADNEPVLGNVSNLFSIFAILSAIIVMNSILIYELYNRNRFLSYLISASNLLIATFIFISTIIIISLN